MNELLIKAEGLSKRFGATIALEQVDFDLRPGELHALVGENGAGKSTLIRILGGVHRPDRGTLRIDGRPCAFANPREALAAGIATIPQELRLVAALSVAENIALGDLPVRRRWGIVPTLDRVRMVEDASALLLRLGYVCDPRRKVGALPFAERQLVAIGKALRRRCRVLILDEPTASLEAREIERLFAVLADMSAQGVGIIFISHRLEEVTRLADRCTVLRDGKVAARWPRHELDVAALIEAMTGRAAERATAKAAVPGARLLEETGTADLPIALDAGAVAGLAGRLGSGTERRLLALFGGAGTMRLRLKHRAATLSSPRAAIAAGIGMVPGERALGLVLNQSVRDNILLPGIRGWRLDKAAGDRLVADLMALLDVRPRRPDLVVAALSGGNQQKVIFAKWLAVRASILLLDDPTQGVDIGAKAQIHALIRDFVRRGGAALMRSSDLAELAQLCDRIYAMRQGRIAARLERRDGIDEGALHRAIGG
jgi:ABC-type sugar transport system ATPase subunit